MKYGFLGIVAAVFVAHEQHGGGNALRGEGGGIMRCGTAERHMGYVLPFRRRSQAGYDLRRYGPDRRRGSSPKVEPYPVPLLDPGNDAMEFTLYGKKNGFVIGADVEREMKQARDDCQPVVSGIGMEPAKGHGHRRALGVQCRPHVVHRRGKGRRRHHRIAPEAARRADMVMTTDDPCIGKAKIAGDARADADGLLRFDEARSLLDMHLDKGGDIGWHDRAVA
jgi:hypothetical protein